MLYLTGLLIFHLALVAGALYSGVLCAELVRLGLDSNKIDRQIGPNFEGGM